jgi:hypothetical protein
MITLAAAVRAQLIISPNKTNPHLIVTTLLGQELSAHNIYVNVTQLMASFHHWCPSNVPIVTSVWKRMSQFLAVRLIDDGFKPFPYYLTKVLLWPCNQRMSLIANTSLLSSFHFFCYYRIP